MRCQCPMHESCQLSNAVTLWVAQQPADHAGGGKTGPKGGRACKRYCHDRLDMCFILPGT